VLKLEEMSSSELRRTLARGSRTVVIPFGSVEYQGGHLPLGSDSALADFVGETVTDRLGAVLAPTIRIGYAGRHAEKLGSLSVPADTLRETAVSVAGCLVGHGFRVVALISTHGGNRPALRQAVQELNERHPQAIACAPSGDVGEDPGQHAGAWLTSAMLAIRPHLVDLASVEPDLRDEVQSASGADGVDHLERFASSVVRQIQEAVRAAQ
jgi:creatinine amidohydrolase/Fe(II)-dependent formamide hydrolase-like protein